MARLISFVALLAMLAVAQANTDKSDFFFLSKSKGAAVAVEAPAPAAPAPCTQVCNDKCDTVFEKACTKVPITTTECAMVKVVNVVKQCSKKCTVVTPAPAPAPVPANPSTPPATISSTTTTTTVTTGASTVTTAPAMSAGKGDKSVMITVTGGKGRKMLAAEAADKKDFLPLLLMAGKGLAKMQAMEQKETQNVVCEDVCEDVPVEGMEKQCKDVTSEVEQCTTTPKTTCVKECNCVTTVASKGKSFMLPIMGKGKGK
ncbi:hypothetical protein OEZ85_004631 [Tetradesmus obliquus]|uniref:Uncharacterized protein n=2 Tax=Tetradesmus obliquus TaxID=3088 RepID=A0ABY8ULT3_TETOB|nr:hypothetical protein OEZ85_004631 [Tetradesmus obliquus]|eukprot:jgi/Sobl393_1/4689/SZX71514.1